MMEPLETALKVIAVVCLACIVDALRRIAVVLEAKADTTTRKDGE